jgi:spore germination protein
MRIYRLIEACVCCCVISSSALAQNASREISGWYNDGWNPRSHDSYLNHHYLLSEVNPFWYDLGTQENLLLADGTISVRSYAFNPQNVIDAHNNGDLVIPSIADHARGQINTILNDPVSRENLINNIIHEVITHDYDGFDLNFESGLASDRAPFTAFVHDLAMALHQYGKRLSVTIQPATSLAEEDLYIFDYAALGQTAVDRIKIMAYDKNFDAGIDIPGPIAPLTWIREVLDHATLGRGIPSSKIHLGLHNYAWTWRQRPNGKYRLLTPHDTFDSVVAKSGTSEFLWNEQAKESWISYLYNSVNHISYVGDAETVAQRVSLADEYDLAGIAFWVLGYEDQGLYDRLCSYFSGVPTPAYRNVALGKPATASSRYSSYYSAAKAVDGNLWEGWLANPTRATATLTVDLEATGSLSEVRIHWGNYDWSINYDIRVSMDGSTWETIFQYTNNLDGGWDTVDITGTVGRFVRIVCLGPKSDNWSYEIYELEIYGTLDTLN